jgi:hypothetical protein
VNEAVTLALDVAVLFILMLASIGALAVANKVPLSRTVVALVLYGLIAAAAVSCSAQQRPVRASTAERCLDLMKTTCDKFSACLGLDYPTCMAESAGCYDITGITQEEADVCQDAIVAAECVAKIPRECVGIAEPLVRAPAKSPQPESRDL